MTVVRRVLAASPEQVWATLGDGWLYPLFVVGASRMREVDAEWPAVDARLHHSAGVWPAVVDDTTTVLLSEPGVFLQLRASGRPGGEAEVGFRLRAHGAGTEVELSEDVVSGPARLVPRPIRSVAVRLRNAETLRRLAWLTERRTADGTR